MTLEKVLDGELLELATCVEEAHGANEVSRAIKRAYSAVVRLQREQLKLGEVPDNSQALHAVVRRELDALMRQH